MSDHFRPLDRDTLFLFPPSVQEWLPADHLARFIAEIVAKLDLGPLRAKYAGRGSEATDSFRSRNARPRTTTVKTRFWLDLPEALNEHLSRADPRYFRVAS